MELFNPLIPGFNPDPSVTVVDGVYYLATSTFEYVPGIPIYRSTDFENWERIGNVIVDPAQAGLAEVPTNGGVWAPTIRHRDGVFFVIVTVAMGVGCIVFSATDPVGAWTGLPIAGVDGIDPDLTWDEDGTAVVTYSGLMTTGPDLGAHGGIRQLDVDLATGAALSESRQLWSGTGGMFPEAPHLYRRGEWWYLLVAEGGTERGHSASIARSRSPRGPFENGPANPLVTARGTDRPVQNTGHGDLVDTPDGTVMVLLGVRPRGLVRSFSALGRETFATRVQWGDDGWPTVEPVELNPRPGASVAWAYGSPLDPGWLALRRTPASAVAAVSADSVTLRGEGTGMDALAPVFLGRRQEHQTASLTVTVDASAGCGGLAVRYNEETFYSVSASGFAAGTVVVAEARIPGFVRRESLTLLVGPVELRLRSTRPEAPGFSLGGIACDVVHLEARSPDGEWATLAAVDGRALSAETAGSFTGRVLGLYATSGEVTFGVPQYRGSEE